MYNDALLDFRFMHEVPEIELPEYDPVIFEPQDVPIIELSDYYTEPVLPAPAPQQRTKVNWLEAKMVYATNPTLSYRDIATKYGVSLKTVKEHGLAEGWLEGRQTVSKTVETNVFESVAEDAAQVTQRHIAGFQQAQELIMSQFERYVAYYDEQERIALSEGRLPTEKEMAKPAMLLAFVRAIDTAIKGERICLQLPITVKGGTVDISSGTDYSKMSEDELWQLIKETDAALEAAKLKELKATQN